MASQSSAQRPITHTASTPAQDPVETVALRVRILNLTAVILPLVGLAAGAYLLWGQGFSWLHLGLMLGMYLLTTLGVTLGFHRLCTHRSFETNAVVKATLGILGSMAVQGPLLRWVATHRRHHQHADDHDDPHSPHQHGSGWWGSLRGLWHAHVGWLLERESPDLSRYVGDLRKDAVLRTVSALFPLWVLLGLLVPTALGGLFTLSWTGALLGFLWGGLARIFLVHHVTWSVNSVCHIWGSRPFASRDESRNNAFFGVLALGEGWHNNHHAFPTSARHGLRWWQFDATYLIIRAMACVGLASNVKVPAPAAVQAKQASNCSQH
ncbi:MAG: fatty acid desaturase [Phycisphaeraceae bacterium]